MKRKRSNPDHRLHQQVIQLLSAYLDGQVDARERYLVEQHLSTCPTCRHDLESLRHTVRLLRRLPAVTPPYPFTVRPERAVPTRPLVWRWLFGLPGLATGLATLMCVIMLAGVLLYNRLVPHGSVMPLARAPVTSSIPATPTVVSIPGAVSSATPVAPGPAVARDELSLPTATPMLTSTQVSRVPSQPIELLAASPVPSPEAPVEEYGAPSPTPLMMQPEHESIARTQPSPQRTEVPSKASAEEEISAQRYESAASPEPSRTAPSAVEVTVAPPASEMPVVSLPTEEAVMPSGPPSAIGAAAASPTIEIPTTPTPPVEKAGLSPEPSSVAEAVAVLLETPVVSPPSEEAVASAEPSPAAEAMAMPPAAETPAVPLETPVVSPPSEEAVTPAEPSPATEAVAVPSTTETPAVPAETPAVSPLSEEAVVSAEPSPAAEVMAMPPATETPTVPTETPAPPLAEEAPASATEEAAPVVPTTVEPGAQEAPSASPTELEPTPTRIPIPVRDLRMTIKPGLIRIEGALPLPPGQPIQAELWREGEIVKWAIPETQRSKVQEEGRFELELKAQSDHPDFDLFQIPPARYEVRIVPLEFEVPVEARIPFDTFPPATKQP